MRASQLRQSPNVPLAGIEPTRLLRAQDFKSCVYTSFTTAAFFWAGDGARTRDLLLGKETFYQLNYSRNVPKIGLEPISQVFQTSAVTILATSAMKYAYFIKKKIKCTVPSRGVEPPWIAPHASETCLSTSSNTTASLYILPWKYYLNHFLIEYCESAGIV